jgi:hypothetical protein
MKIVTKKYNKFEKLVHFVGFTVEIYNSYFHQISPELRIKDKIMMDEAPSPH